MTKNWIKHEEKSSSNTSTNSTPSIEQSKDDGTGSNIGIPYDKVAIIDGATGLQRTFGDYYNLATNLAASLKYDMNVNSTIGDESSTTVAFFCPNHVDYLPICLAVSLCGAKITPINPSYTVTELSTVLHRSRSTILITHSSIIDVAMKSVKDNPNSVQHIIVVQDEDNDVALPLDVISLNSLKNHSKPLLETVDEVRIFGDTMKHPFNIPYSSGTTGLPKGVCLSHGNLCANLLQTYAIEEDGLMLPHHKVITPLPFYHMYAFAVSLLYSSWQGHTLITSSGRFNMEQFCQLIELHKPQRAHIVPPIIIGLEKHPIVDKYDLSSLQVIVSAAAPLSSETEIAVQNRLSSSSHGKGDKKTSCIIKQFFGMSETSPMVALNPDKAAKSGSVGPLVPSSAAKIIDPETGISLGPYKSGELVLQGPHIMMGYLDDIDKTNACLSSVSGWMRTGDVGYYDTDGYFYITDRIKELIKVNGYPVAPAELESILLTHPKVNDVAIISVPDREHGELPRAYIVLKDELLQRNEGDKTTESNVDDDQTLKDEINKWINERVAPYKRLKGGIVFTDSIPKSASGKILRRILRDEFKNELSKKA